MHDTQTLPQTVGLHAEDFGRNVQRIVDEGVPLVNVFDTLAAAAAREIEGVLISDLTSANSFLYTWHRDLRGNKRLEAFMASKDGDGARV